jgi:hypothetical protein
VICDISPPVGENVLLIYCWAKNNESDLNFISVANMTAGIAQSV